MPSWAYDSGPQGIWTFVFVTLVLGGLAAFVSGRSIAQTWRPLWMVPAYMALLAAGVRFIHYAIFGEVFLSLPLYLVDLAALCLFAVVGYRLMRAEQMARQYPWLLSPAPGNPRGTPVNST